MVSAKEISKLNQEIDSLKLISRDEYQVTLPQTQLRTMYVVSVGAPLYGVGFIGRGRFAYYSVRGITRQAAIDVVKSFDFGLYDVAMAVFKDHKLACRIALGDDHVQEE